MTDDEIALWLITKGTMEDKPVLSLAADRILRMRAERDRLREALRDGRRLLAIAQDDRVRLLIQLEQCEKRHE